MGLTDGRFFADAAHRSLTITVAPVAAVAGGSRVYVHTGFETVLAVKVWGDNLQPVAGGYVDLEDLLLAVMGGTRHLRPYRAGRRGERDVIRCRRCSRVLEDEASRTAGIGDDCVALEAAFMGKGKVAA